MNNDFVDGDFCIDWRFYSEIMYHLVTNAIKFNKNKGKITIRTQISSEIAAPLLKTISEDQKWGYLTTEIKDTGLGMSAAKIAGLFKTFKRSLDQTKKYLLNQDDNKIAFANEGIGLGMTTAKILVEACGGFIDVKSKENEGTTIVFSVRICSNPHRSAQSSLAATPDFLKEIQK